MSTKEEALKKVLEQKEGLLKGRGESLQQVVEEAVRKALDGALHSEESGEATLPWTSSPGSFTEGKDGLETVFLPEMGHSLGWHRRIHALASNIQRKIGEGKKGAVLFVSSVPGEGTTTLCTNISLALARIYSGNILLLDGNAQHPEIHKLFNTEPVPGLTDILMEKINWEGAVRQSNLKNYYVLPFGHPLQEPLSLLGSVAMEELLKVLKTGFDFIFLDAPPILGSVEAEMIVPWVEAVVLIIKAQVTPREVVIRAAERIIRLKEFMGAILNQQAFLFSPFPGKGPK